MNLKLLKVVFPKSIACSFCYYYFMFYLLGSNFEKNMAEGTRASWLNFISPTTTTKIVQNIMS